MPSAKQNEKPERDYALWVVIPDVHIPHEDRRAVNAVEQYIADEWWDGWVCLGDLLDCQSISDFDRDYARRRVTAQTMQEEFDVGNKWLDRHLATVTARNPDAKKVLISGNHEHRTERYADRNPEMAGSVELQRHLRLKERGIQYVDFWGKGELFRLGKLYLGHGAYTVQNHAAKHVRDYGANLLYGHVHDIQSHYIRRRGNNHPIMAQSIGCLCKYDQAYMRGRPTNWIHGFAVVYLFPDGAFQIGQVAIINGRFVGPTNGKVYKGVA